MVTGHSAKKNKSTNENWEGSENKSIRGHTPPHHRPPPPPGHHFAIAAAPPLHVSAFWLLPPSSFPPVRLGRLRQGTESPDEIAVRFWHCRRRCPRRPRAAATDLEVRLPYRDSASFSGIRTLLKERGTLGVVRLACLGGIGAGPAFCVLTGYRVRWPCECARDRGDLPLALELCGEILVAF